MQQRDRRSLYRQCKRLIARIVWRNWTGPRHILDRALRHVLRRRSRTVLLKILRDAAFASAIAMLVVGSPHGFADPPLELSDVELGLKGFVFDGDTTNGAAGWSVAGVGDINGDGTPDVAVSAQGVGKVYVIFGKADLTDVSPADIEAGTGGFVITGGPSGTTYDFPVAGAGDVNGDGKDDLIIGHPYATPDNLNDAGEAYIIFGKATTEPVALVVVRAGFNGIYIKGGAPDRRAGRSVAAAGNINGDGFADIIVGAPYADQGTFYNQTGFAYVIFGISSTSAIDLTTIDSGTGGFVIQGNYDFGAFGHSVSGAGDVNGDGTDDVVVGAPYNQDGYTYSPGEVYVVFGKSTTTPVSTDDIESGTGGFVIHGSDEYDYAGWSVSGAGDVNGDGKDDIIFGVPYGDPNQDYNGGEAYVVFGKSTGSALTVSQLAAGEGGFVINGEGPREYAGRSVAAAGDVNGDGLADVLVGAPEAAIGDDRTTDIVGKGYVVLGKADTNPIELTDIQDGLKGFAALGRYAYTYTAYSAAGVGDMDGDGFDDVIIGFPDADLGNYTYAGRAYILFSPLAVPISTTVSNVAGDSPIAGGKVFIERSDGSLGFESSFAGVGESGALYRSAPADEQFYRLRAIASGFAPSDEVQVQSDRTGDIVADLPLSVDSGMAAPNILRVRIELVDNEGAATGADLLTKDIEVRDGGVDLGLTPILGLGEVVFLGVPVGDFTLFAADTADYTFESQAVSLGTGVDKTVVLKASAIPPNATPLRAELPGLIVGSLLNSSATPAAGFPNGLVLHTQPGNPVTTFVRSTAEGDYTFPDALAGEGFIQAFSESGSIAGTKKPVNVVSGQIYGDNQDTEDTLLTVPLDREDSDFDGLPDTFEITHFGNVTQEGPHGDPDADGLDNFDEFTANTDPTKPDTDDDTQTDPFELANGSDPTSSGDTATLPDEVWLDFGHTTGPQAGTLLNPFSTLQDALNAVAPGGTITIKGDVDQTTGPPPAGTINHPATLQAFRGTIRIE